MIGIKNIILTLACLASVSILNAQIITTVVGGGSSSADGVLATNTRIYNCAQVTIDNCGNIFFNEAFYHKVRRVDVNTGIVTTVAGTGVAGYNGDGIPATSAKLHSATFLTFDSANNLYIGDGLNNRIRRVDAVSGIITTIVGDGTLACTGDGGPATAAASEGGDIEWDRNGNFYLGDKRRIRKIDRYGIISTVAGTGLGGPPTDGVPATATDMAYPLGMALDRQGNIFFIDSAGSIRKVTISTGIIRRVAGTGIIIGPYTGDGIPATTCHMNPFDLWIDDTGNIFAAGHTNQRVIKIDTFGITHTVAGTGIGGFSGDGGPATNAQFLNLRSAKFDANGNMYIADFNNNRVRKVTFPGSRPTIPTVAITVMPNDTLCPGTGATYSAVINGGFGTFTYAWYVNGTLTGATGSTYSYTPAHGDSVRCAILSSCSAVPVGSNTIHMVWAPTTTPTITLTGPAAAPVGSSVGIAAAVAGAGSSYLLRWYNRGAWLATTSVPALTYTKPPGTDTITARVVNTLEGACIDSVLSAGHRVAVGNTGLPAAHTLAGLAVSPIPTSGTLHIAAAAPMARISLTNLLGQVVHTQPCLGTTSILDISTLPPGTYLLRATGTDGSTAVRRVVKE